MHLEGFCQGFIISKVQNYKKAWMTSFMFKKFMYLICSKWNYSNQSSPFNFGWHGLHLTLEIIEHAQQFGLDMIILSSHTSHAL